MNKNSRFYFNTRDLMMMAALAAIGGVASTYINLIGDFFQSLLGFAGTTQWAAGLHVIWFMLAAALVRKPGAATTTGILKGFVEFMSGNTHGLLVLIVDILAGLIADLVLLPKKDKQPSLFFYLAAGLSSASNIFIFQFFASIPADLLTVLVVLFTSGIAFISGVVFGGVMVRSLLISLQKIGIITEQEYLNDKRKLGWIAGILFIAVVLAFSTGSLYFKQQGKTQGISFVGNISNPYTLSENSSEFIEIEVEAEVNGISRLYSGFPLKDLVKRAEPLPENELLRISASDGYSFLISLEEVYSNPNLIISTQEVGGKTIFNIVGANSSKAWVRGVDEIQVIKCGQFEIGGNAAAPFIFTPSEWVNEMDSTFLDLDGESVKLQGVALRALWQHARPADGATALVISCGDQTFNIPAKDFLGSDEIRVFIYLDEEGMEFIMGRMNGEVILRGMESLVIQ